MPRALLVLPACLVLVLPLSAGAVPQQVAHQGELYDADGPVTDSVNFTFRLFDAETTGNEVWLEDRTIDVVDGLYSVLLGAETPIAQVLAEEPALWLEITVDGGDPLLPRQPLGSAPYAIVADTAVNVDGGTVNASSVSVNSSAIIDSGGNWVGGAGSIGWTAIDGVPADEDTLGGLSCADGDRAVWNDGLGQWECGSATVELDRLDVAGATTGDVLTFDASAVGWAEPSPAITQAELYVVAGANPSSCNTSVALCNDADDVLLDGWCAREVDGGGAYNSAQGLVDSGTQDQVGGEALGLDGENVAVLVLLRTEHEGLYLGDRDMELCRHGFSLRWQHHSLRPQYHAGGPG